GLSSAPAIGVYVAGLVAEKLGLAEKPDFIAQRRDIVHVRELPLSERQALVERDPAYGNILCRCEQISEGEIRDAIRRTPGARSLDGVKRRVRAGMGRCQGGFCAPRVMELLSEELGVPQTQLTKSGGGSLLLTGETKEVQA
ncbi:MAG: (2Fe-2S)-binding protein, partial [Oscillospiraceae bacterium]|nr:(2Fe-2S)-binding protein [Oscillospiraceae bacterium]